MFDSVADSTAQLFKYKYINKKTQWWLTTGLDLFLNKLAGDNIYVLSFIAYL